MPALAVIRGCIGHDVDVDGVDGRLVRGRLVNATRRSLWVVEDDIDVIVPLTLVSALRRSA